jgi:drug/metabolite transporter (DMT)-like permease
MRLFLLTATAMLAFALNSLLCRHALKTTAIDPASFATIRIVSGAIALGILVSLRNRALPRAGSWSAALALAAYAVAFSFAYASLTAATGALILFGAVQATMIGYGRWRGDRFSGWQAIGFVVALAGLVGLMLPGLAAPPVVGSALMVAAGVAWGAYTVLGRNRGEPLAVNAGNFARAAVFAALASLASASNLNLDRAGVVDALLSGAVTSGIGYAIWYAALRELDVTRAAVSQLSVPVIAALGGIVLLGEAPTLRLALASIAILGGIALVVVPRRAALAPPRP